MAYVFGSEARGTAGPMSDIDIAVLTKPSVNFEHIETRLFNDLATALKTDNLDLIDIRTASPLLAHRSVLGGVPLLFHDPHREAILKMNVLRTYEDHRYLFAIKERAFL